MLRKLIFPDFGPILDPLGPDPARIRPGTPAALARGVRPTPEARDAKKWAKYTMLKAET